MEHIQDKIFYHIGNFDCGKTYTIGCQLNPFFDYFNHFGYEGAIDWDETKKLLSAYQLYARERIFEDVRTEMFPNFPSRMSCIWLIPSDNLSNRIAFWNTNISHNSKICKLSCTGRIHIADESFLASRFGYLPTYRTDAIQYWSGKFQSNSFVHQEVIFTGTIYVIEKYATLNDIVQ
ncbi:DUF2441 domain-containing protein [Pectinatus haikarae]|uniref:DUF2441 domain-containing protein n=1 Tax=Pectinatus haikarae TaxID=349096 RepID=UPI0018C66D6F